jgi:hypothetical protein
MNNDTIDSRAFAALSELIGDEDAPLNDDDFADLVEQMIPNITEDDRITITRRMITICDRLGIAH